MNSENTSLQEVVWEYYSKHGRHDLPWRQPDESGVFDAYRVVVSEMMLQQTQVNRVIAKYTTFLSLFPTVESLASADLGDVLRAWQGLGYNRRAKFLWEAAAIVVNSHAGTYPETVSELTKLPGIGVNTAGAICAYAYDMPADFIETNIRTVIIHHFFPNQADISDESIRKKVHEVLPENESPREWYWALMDYGTYLKQATGNLNKLSKAYTKQTRFQGSKRQVRGAILRLLSIGTMSEMELRDTIADERLNDVLDDLMKENLIKKAGTGYSL